MLMMVSVIVICLICAMCVAANKISEHDMCRDFYDNRLVSTDMGLFNDHSASEYLLTKWRRDMRSCYKETQTGSLNFNDHRDLRSVEIAALMMGYAVKVVDIPNDNLHHSKNVILGSSFSYNDKFGNVKHVLWGAGASNFSDSASVAVKSSALHAVRGPLTYALFQSITGAEVKSPSLFNNVYADCIMLLPLLLQLPIHTLPETSNNTGPICVVPHPLDMAEGGHSYDTFVAGWMNFDDGTHALVIPLHTERNSKDDTYKRTKKNPTALAELKLRLLQISKCSLVLSFTLEGIQLSDVLGVPVRWIRDTEKYQSSKLMDSSAWNDYLMSYGKGVTGHRLQDYNGYEGTHGARTCNNYAHSLVNGVQEGGMPLLSRTLVAQSIHRLLNTFPYEDICPISKENMFFVPQLPLPKNLLSPHGATQYNHHSPVFLSKAETNALELLHTSVLEVRTCTDCMTGVCVFTNVTPV